MPVCTQAFFLHITASYHYSRQHYRDVNSVCIAGAAILPAKLRLAPGFRPHVLIRYMALLFVPIGVGVMQYFLIYCARNSARW